VGYLADFYVDLPANTAKFDCRGFELPKYDYLFSGSIV
jgi:hypothetical protein